MNPSSRIVIIATDLSTRGGVTRVIRDVADILHSRLGHQVEIVSARSEACPTYPFTDGISVSYNPRGSIASYVRTIWAVRRSKPDYVLSSWTQDNILVSVLFIGARSRVILAEHISFHFHSRPIRILRWLAYQTAWRLLVLNRRELAYYGRFLRRVRLLPNPVPNPGEITFTSKRKRVIAVGHLDQNKNFSEALRAFALSGIASDGWSLEVVGAGSQEDELKALIAELKLDSAHIRTPTDDISAIYREASIILVTSTKEVFSLVLAEAMAARVVPIAFAADGPKFILEQFSDLLVPIGDTAALATRLSALVSQDLEVLSARVSVSIDRRFSSEIIAADWRNLLR